MVYCNDLKILIDLIKRERGLNDLSTFVRIGIDGGGGFIKVCLSVFDPTNIRSKENNSFVDSGVRKAFIIGIVPDIPELYVNILHIWNTVGVQKLAIPFTIASDLKLCNLLIGLMTHGSMHPCTWCTVDKHHLHQRGKTRTFDDLTSKFWSFYNAGGIAKTAKEHGNVVHPSIIKGDVDNAYVIDIIPPPELHLLTGIFRTIFNSMKSVWPEAESWPQKFHVSKESWHGGTFTGNATRTLLKNVDSLRAMCPLHCLPFVEVLTSLSTIVTSCFSWDLADNYKLEIERFKHSYLHLEGVPVTPKVHALFYHVSEFCDKRQRGLAAFSEQASESVHHDFQTVWSNFRIKETDHPSYGSRLLRAVCQYNSQHL